MFALLTLFRPVILVATETDVAIMPYYAVVKMLLPHI
jgi:hypothetical protein